MSKRNLRAHRLYSGLGAFLNAFSDENQEDDDEKEKSEKESCEGTSNQIEKSVENDEKENFEENFEEKDDEDYLEEENCEETSNQIEESVENEINDGMQENFSAEFASVFELLEEKKANLLEKSENFEKIDDEKLEDSSSASCSWAEYEFCVLPKEILTETEEFNSGRKRNNFLKGVKWSPDGSCLLTNSDDHKLRVFSGTETLYQSQKEPPKDSNLVQKVKATMYNYSKNMTLFKKSSCSEPKEVTGSLNKFP